MSASPDESSTTPRSIGRYALYDEIASGGMASVHLGRLQGPVGFARTVAIKHLHPHLAGDPDLVTMFVDEARLAARIQHPNVVAMLDVVLLPPELFLVMEYVHGESLARLARALRVRRELVPPRIASAILAGVLYGLHAAHEAKTERGEPMNLVHRDVSPQNVLVGVDGVPRVADFGVAKAAGRLQTTSDGQLKGKAAYMSPEQVADKPLDRRTDVYAASVVLWELLAGRRLFEGENALATMRMVLERKTMPPSRHHPSLPPALDDVVLRGLAIQAEERFATAREMAIALEQAVSPATAREVGEWVDAVSGDALRSRASRVAEIESASFRGDVEGLESLRRRRPDRTREELPTVHEDTPPPGAGIDVSSVSVARPGTEAPSPPVKRMSRRAWMFVTAGGATVAMAIVVGVAALSGGPAVPRPAATAAELPSAAAAIAAPGPTATAAVPAVGLASATDAASAPSSAAPRHPRAVSMPLRRPIPAKPNCADPFVWTSDGRKIPRPECF